MNDGQLDDWTKLRLNKLKVADKTSFGAQIALSFRELPVVPAGLRIACFARSQNDLQVYFPLRYRHLRDVGNNMIILEIGTRTRTIWNFPRSRFERTVLTSSSVQLRR